MTDENDWYPTMELRWEVRNFPFDSPTPILQQKFSGYDAYGRPIGEEWRDIPFAPKPERKESERGGSHD